MASLLLRLTQLFKRELSEAGEFSIVPSSGFAIGVGTGPAQPLG